MSALRERFTATTAGVGLPAVLAIAVAVVVGLVLKLIDLGEESLWSDEGITWRAISGSWSDLGHIYTDSEPSMVFHYVVLKAWTAIAGTSEVALRLPSAIFAVAVIPVVALIARRIFGTPAALIAAGILALSPFLLRYGQEARTYAFVLLLTSVSTLTFIRALDREDHDPKAWALWVVASAAAVWAHLFAAFVLVAQAIALVFHPRKPPLTTLIASAAALLLLVAPLLYEWLTYPLDRFNFIPETTWAIVRDTFDQLAGDDTLRWILLAGIAVALVAAIRNRRRLATEGPQAWELVLLGGWLVVPFALTAIASIYQPTFQTRYLIIAVPGLVVLAAGGIAALRPRALIALPLIAIAILSAARISDSYETSTKADWRTAGAVVTAAAQPGDLIVAVRGGSSFGYYYEPEFDPAETPVITSANQFLAAPFDRGNRVWLVLFQGPFKDPALAGLVRSYVDDARALADSQQLSGILVELWSPTPGEAEAPAA